MCNDVNIIIINIAIWLVVVSKRNCNPTIMVRTMFGNLSLAVGNSCVHFVSSDGWMWTSFSALNSELNLY